MLTSRALVLIDGFEEYAMQTLAAYVKNFADKRALYDWEERAGIHEYDGKVSRAQAEVQAFKDVFPTLTLPSCYDHFSKTSNG